MGGYERRHSVRKDPVDGATMRYNQRRSPTKAEIAEECRKIRQGWTPQKTELRRYGTCIRAEYMTRVLSIGYIDIRRRYIEIEELNDDDEPY